MIEPAILQKMLTKSVDLSFNRISVDGDSSTNDTVLVMAGGAAANVVIDSTVAKEAVVFQNALSALCLDLALQKYHLTTKQAGEIAALCNAKKIVPFHYSPRYTGQAHQMESEAITAFNKIRHAAER